MNTLEQSLERLEKAVQNMGQSEMQHKALERPVFDTKNAEAKANPGNTALAEEAAALMGQRQTLFMGETLKGLLLNAFAFWQVGQIAMYASIASFIGGLLMLILTIMGYAHLRKTPSETTI